MPKRRMVVVDNDNTLIKNKEVRVTIQTVEEATEFREGGGIVAILTGGPSTHVPTEFPHDLLLAESGGLIIMEEEFGPFSSSIQPSSQGVLARKQLAHILGINPDNVFVQVGGQTVISEGIRLASITFLAGDPPHYQHLKGSSPMMPHVIGADLNVVELTVREAITRWQLPLKAYRGRDGTYEWLDVVSVDKATTMSYVLDLIHPTGEVQFPVYMLGDGASDLDVMRLPGIHPVGFSNSIPEIRELARSGGTYIDLPGPEGGVAEFFHQLNRGQL